MSTQLALGLVGGAIGSFFGPTGAQIGFALGSAAGASLQTIRNEGPRLSDLKAPQSSYGSVLPYVEGMVRTAGVWAWNSDKQEISQTTDGGGKGGPSVENTTYTYKMDALILLSENELGGVRRVWSNGKLIWSATETAEDDTLLASATTDAWDRMTFYSGAADQLPDPTYEAAVGSGNAPAYRGRGSVFLQGINLGGSGQPPLLTFEVFSAGAAATPGVLEDFESGLVNYIEAEGDKDEFYLQVGAAGNQVVTPKSDTRNEIHRVFDEVLYPRTVSFVVSMPGLLDSDDAGIIGFEFSSAIQVGFNPFREFAVDSYRRALLTLNGLEPKYFGPAAAGSALLQGRYYRVTVANTAETDGKVSATIHDFETGALIHSLEWTGVASNYEWMVDRISFWNDDDIDTIAAAYARIQIGGGRAAPDAVPLADAIERQCLRAGLLSSEVDVTAVTGTVRGFAVSSVTAPRTVLEMLMGAYQLEALESGGKLTFRPRAQATVLSIPHDDLGASEGEPVEPLPLVRANDQELPAQVVVRFSNALNDYQDGAEASARIGANLAVVDAIELPLVLSPTEARRIAEIRKADIVNSLHRVEQLQLDSSYAALEPGDAIEVFDQDGQAFRLRIGRITDSGLVRRIEAAVDEQSAMTGAANADEGYEQGNDIGVRTGTSLQLLDIPLLRDVDDGLIHYLAVGKLSNSGQWPGAQIYRGRSDAAYVSIASMGDRTYIGRTLEALGDFPEGAVFDERNTLTVSGVGELESWTRDEILAGASAALLVGDEIILYRSAVETYPGNYTISGLLRGRRGTEWAVAGHESGERVVLLGTSGMRVITNTAAEVGQAFDFKAVTSGTALDAAYPQSFTNSAVSRRPFAPVDARVSRAADGRYAVSWKRRTRLATRFLGATQVNPLGEAAEAYEVDLLQGDPLEVLRTYPTDEPELALGTLIPGVGFSVGVEDVHAVSGGGWVANNATYGKNDFQYFNRFDADGELLATSTVLGQFLRASLMGGGYLYVSGYFLDPVTGSVNRTSIYRLDPNNIAAVPVTHVTAVPSDAEDLAWDGTHLWSIGYQTGKLRKHDAADLTVLNEYTVKDMTPPVSGSVAKLATNGTGAFFIIDTDIGGGVLRYDPGTGEVWSGAAASYFCEAIYYVAGVLWCSSSTGWVILDPADGSVIADSTDSTQRLTQLQPVYDGDKLLAYPVSGGSPNPFEALVLDAATGEHIDTLSPGAGVYVMGATGDKLVTNTLRLSGLEYVFQGALLQDGGSLVGSVLRIYQLSTEAGRSQPLEIEITE